MFGLKDRQNCQDRQDRAFQAYVDCPHCGEWGYHFLRAPSQVGKNAKAKYSEDLAKWLLDCASDEVRFTQILAWGKNDYVAKLGDPPKPMAPKDESHFEVVRQCTSCDKEWGEN